MTLAPILSVLVCAGLFVHSWMAYTVTGILPGYAGTFYWFTIPHLVLLPLSAVMLVLDAMRRKRATFIAALICISCLLPSWFFGGSREGVMRRAFSQKRTKRTKVGLSECFVCFVAFCEDFGIVAARV